MIYFHNIIFCVFLFTFSVAQNSTSTSTVSPATQLLDKVISCQNTNDINGYWNSTDNNDVCDITIEDGYKIRIIIGKFYINSSDSSNVLITSDESNTSEKIQSVLTWNVTKETYVFPNNHLKMQLISKHKLAKNEQFSIFWEQFGNKTVSTERPSTTETYPTPNPNSTDYYYSTYLFGKLPEEFKKDVVKFKNLLTKKSNDYCHNNNLILKENITIRNIDITLAIRCLYLWPNADKCIEVHYAIPASVQNSDSYELSYKRLKAIWETISDEELEKVTGWQKYSMPNNNFTLMQWLLVCFGIVIIVLLVFLGLQLIGRHNFNLSKKATIEDTTPRNQFPTVPFQETPQMFGEEPYQYQQMHAHTNQAFLFDDLSDEEKFVRQRPSDTIQRS